MSEVVSQKGATIGDENMAPREPTYQVTEEKVDAQVSPPRQDAAAKVDVHEVFVQVDEVITDPSSPLAVQIPDAGRGFLDLPIHALANGSPEDQFKSAKAKKS